MSVFNWFKKFTPTHIYLSREVEVLNMWYIDYNGILTIKVRYENGLTVWAEDIFLYELNTCGK